MEFFGPLIAGVLGIIIVLTISLFIIEEGVRRGMRKARADERAELEAMEDEDVYDD